MAYVEWTNSLSVGMADIDVQHQHFISLLNKTKEAVDKGAQKEALRGKSEIVFLEQRVVAFHSHASLAIFFPDGLLFF